jgi:hypothetical protein
MHVYEFIADVMKNNQMAPERFDFGRMLIFKSKVTGF